MPAPTLSRGVAAAFVLASAGVSAQPPGSGYSFAIAPFAHFDSDLDSGGEASFAGVFTSLGRRWALDERSSLGFRLAFDYEDWDFNGPVAFGGSDPWGEIYRLGLSLPYAYAAGNGWLWTVTPTVGYSGESGASSSDAIEYGATLSAAQRVRPNLLLGFGVGLFEQIEDTNVYPFVIVDWRIDERWRLSNPLPAGPAGPAGLELSYDLAGGWETGLAVTYRSKRFRLDSDGPFPDGVGEHRYIPVVARVGRSLSETLQLDFYLGAETGTKLRIEDRNGNRLFSDDQDSGFLLGASLVGRF
jgi:hypothetical protein